MQGNDETGAVQTQDTDTQPPAETLEQRQQRLQEELAALDRQQHEQEEQQRRERAAERASRLDPALKEEVEDLTRRAQEALDREFPPPWQPHKPESGHPAEIVAIVQRIDPQVGPSKLYGTYSAAVEVLTVEGDHWTIWMDHGGALFSQLLRLKVQPGEIVAVRYRGKRQSETTGFTYHDFRLVRVDGDQDARPVDYNELTQTIGGEQAALPAVSAPTTQTEGPSQPASAQLGPDDDFPF